MMEVQCITKTNDFKLGQSATNIRAFSKSFRLKSILKQTIIHMHDFVRRKTRKYTTKEPQVNLRAMEIILCYLYVSKANQVSLHFMNFQLVLLKIACFATFFRLGREYECIY